MRESRSRLRVGFEARDWKSREVLIFFLTFDFFFFSLSAS